MQMNYDVVIMGGGPAGSTLGSLLKRKTDASVLIVESEPMPREHIGESLVHACMPVFEEAGSLSKVLESECWVQKFGGIFFWDQDKPATTFFDYPNWREDGVYRWAIHTDRAEFDKILLDNARDQGVDIIEGATVCRYTSEGDQGTVELNDGRYITARVFVDASGRNSRIASRRKPVFLSQYKNMAIWNHYLNCEFAQNIASDWNIFHKDKLSPIVCVAFEDGWIWYIPVPKIIDGKRVITHSIGIVTDPTLVKEPEKDYTDPDIFIEKIRSIRLLKDLTANAVPVRNEMQIIANYSMIQDRFCDLDERWILVGDAAYFVDPLFSSGVTFASGMASCATLLIRSTLSQNLSKTELRRLWEDYDKEWHNVAQSFALSIDQWYHAIANDNPDSVYWKVRQNTVTDLSIREASFQGLIDAAITPDLLQIMTKGSLDQRDLDAQGPFLRMLADLNRAEPDDDVAVRLRSGTECIDSRTLAVPGFKASLLAANATEEERRHAGEYWQHLRTTRRSPMPSPHDDVIPCVRFIDIEGRDRLRHTEDPEGSKAVHAALSGPFRHYGEMKRALSPSQRTQLRKLVVAGLIETRMTA
jgi:flavin-dependent dehydrogenase